MLVTLVLLPVHWLYKDVLVSKGIEKWSNAIDVELQLHGNVESLRGGLLLYVNDKVTKPITTKNFKYVLDLVSVCRV